MARVTHFQVLFIFTGGKWHVGRRRTLQDKTQLSETSAVKNDVHTSILSLAGYIHNIDDVGILKEIKTRVMSTVNFIKANNQIRPSLPKTNLQPATTHIDKQRSFFSTKKKRKGSVRIRKPTAAEKKSISKALETHSGLYGSKKEKPLTLEQHTGGKLSRQLTKC